MLAGKKILLAVTGSIAAYKTAFFIRSLVKEKADVRVIMTDSAKTFITPLTLATLSKSKVYSDFFEESTGIWESHVDLGLWADIMIIAPASANTLARMANGICDNFLLATYLSAKCPVFFAPSMDLDMHEHPATKTNIQKLQSYGNQLIPSEEGELASGLSGPGRMAEPEHLLAIVKDFFEHSEALKGKKILITSGPTHEKIDAVRFIGNNSSGKMGAALAETCLQYGASVTFITGPTHHLPSGRNLETIAVTSAEEMFLATEKEFKTADITIFSAAVSDYRPKNAVDHKLKKNGQSLVIELTENVDIASQMGAIKKENQFTVGFALETDEEGENAKNKLAKKSLDLIVLNSLNDEGAGFSHDTNKVTIINKHNKSTTYELKPKNEVASDIVKAIIDEVNG